MSTLEALNAISEAIQAHAKLPEIERQLREAQENADWKTLELDEANKLIAELREIIASQNNDLEHFRNEVRDRNLQISELRDRNTMLDNSLQDAQATIRNQEASIHNNKLINEAQKQTIASLEARLSDAKGYGERLAETLKSIGAKIVSAVEVPEVTPSAPFPVDNTVGLSDSPIHSVDNQSDTNHVEALAEPTDADLVGVVGNEGSSFNTPPKDNSLGCYTSPITPSKQWWEY
jgi:predicted RNase H-like nuclease (RuvC/YqgF family)